METNGANINVLKEVFEFVKKIEYKFHKDVLPVDDPIKMFHSLSALVVEVGEALQEDTRWKVLLASKKEPVFNKDKKGVELGDIFIFLVGAILYSDIDYEEFEEIIVTKLQEVYSLASEN